MKPWEIIAEDRSKARRAGHLRGNQKRFWRDSEWQRIGNQMKARLSLRGRTGFLFATLLEQFNLPCIETVVRCDDLYFPRLHARRDDRTGAL